MPTCHCDIQACQAVIDGAGSCDGLVNLFETIMGFLHRLDIYIKIPPTTSMTEIVVNMMVELLFTLALAAKQRTQGPQRESVLSNTIPGLDAVQRKLNEIFQEIMRLSGYCRG